MKFRTGDLVEYVIGFHPNNFGLGIIICDKIGQNDKMVDVYFSKYGKGCLRTYPSTLKLLSRGKRKKCLKKQ